MKEVVLATDVGYVRIYFLLLSDFMTWYLY